MMDLSRFVFIFASISQAFTFALGNDLDESRFAKILKFEFNNDHQNSYYYTYENSDNQNKEERGDHLDTDDFIVTGSYSYVGPDGITYAVQYTADKDGFHPTGDHLKVPPYTPWPTNRHIQYEDDYTNDVSVRRPVQDYLPTSEKPPQHQHQLIYNDEASSGVSLNSIATTTLPPPPQVTNAYIPVKPVVDIKSHSGSSLSSELNRNFYLPTTQRPQQFIYTNEIGSGSTSVPLSNHHHQPTSRSGRSRNLAAYQRAQNDLFEVIQNNHSSRGVFKE